MYQSNRKSSVEIQEKIKKQQREYERKQTDEGLIDLLVTVSKELPAYKVSDLLHMSPMEFWTIVDSLTRINKKHAPQKSKTVKIKPKTMR